jgi:hypothetical protein
MLLLIALVVPSASQTSSHLETEHFEFDCHEVAPVTSEYLSRHGIFVHGEGSHDLRILGFDYEPLAPRKSVRDRKKWTDARGHEITDFKVYWTYADRKTGDKSVPGIWRLRLAHYQPRGEIKLLSAGGRCSVEFDLFFETSGANVIGILPVDSQWSYHSNGVMEREYLEGISAALTERKTGTPKTKVRP